MKNKYYESLELCNEMTSRFPLKRPDSEKILERKNSWALNEELEISEELEDMIAFVSELDDENQIFSSILNLLINIQY
jgi:hypothetical protein